eukprot:1030605-Prorocentrum_minimum.AAC.1
MPATGASCNGQQLGRVTTREAGPGGATGGTATAAIRRGTRTRARVFFPESDQMRGWFVVSIYVSASPHLRTLELGL